MLIGAMSSFEPIGATLRGLGQLEQHLGIGPNGAINIRVLSLWCKASVKNFVVNSLT